MREFSSAARCTSACLEIFTVVIVSDLGTGGVKKMGSWWTQHLGQSIACCLTMKNLLASWASSSCFEGYWLCNQSSLSLLPSQKSVQLRPKIPHWGPPVLAQVQITTELLVHLKMECYTMLQQAECIWAKHGWVFTGGLCSLKPCWSYNRDRSRWYRTPADSASPLVTEKCCKDGTAITLHLKGQIKKVQNREGGRSWIFIIPFAPQTMSSCFFSELNLLRCYWMMYVTGRVIRGECKCEENPVSV